MLDCNGAKSFHRLLVDVHNCSLQLREFVTVKNRGPEGIAHKDHDLVETFPFFLLGHRIVEDEEFVTQTHVDGSHTYRPIVPELIRSVP